MHVIIAIQIDFLWNWAQSWICLASGVFSSYLCHFWVWSHQWSNRWPRLCKHVSGL